MVSPYNYYRNKLVEVKGIISQFVVLPKYFDDSFFQNVKEQIDFMEQKKWNGPINSFFLLFLGDSNNGYTQMKLLNDYLKLIIEHPTTTNADRRHIKGQIKTDNSTDTLFEISILGNLLKQLSPADIELFPRTVGNRDVEARLMIDKRWIYLDATALNDSEQEQTELVELLNKGGGIGRGTSIDFKKDMDRFIRKLEYKSQQFLPNTPNVLAISFFGTRPLFVHSDWGIKSATIVPNISLLLEFDRKNLNNVTTKNCDDSNPLSKNEISLLKELFSGSSYQPLVY